MEPPRDQPKDAYDSLLVMGTSDGKVHLLDLTRNKIISTINLISPDVTVFCVDWNVEGYLAIASTEKNVMIKKYEPEQKTFYDVTQLGTNCESRYVCWNSIRPNLLACGLFNGQIVVFDSTTL